MEQIGKYVDAAGPSWVRGGFWFKPDGAPQFSCDRPAVPGECIAIMHTLGSKRWNGRGRRGFWSFNHARGGERNHETPKPVDLMLQLVADFSDPAELVWDPYCGSGTTGVACLRLGRRFLGHEMQPHYAEIAAQRLEAETRGLTLQDVRRGQTSILDVLGDS
jgi:site-specific DNA-methyltransferase (adenine-specific)